MQCKIECLTCNLCVWMTGSHGKSNETWHELDCTFKEQIDVKVGAQPESGVHPPKHRRCSPLFQNASCASGPDHRCGENLVNINNTVKEKNSLNVSTHCTLHPTNEIEP